MVCFILGILLSYTLISCVMLNFKNEKSPGAKMEELMREILVPAAPETLQVPGAAPIAEEQVVD